MTLCDETRALMSAYLDDEFDSENRTDFEEHIEGCEECSNMLGELSELVSKLRMIPEVRTPDNFHEESMQKLRDRLNPIEFFTPGLKNEKDKKKGRGKDKGSKKKEARSGSKKKIAWPRVGIAGGALVASMFLISIIGSSVNENTPRLPVEGSKAAGLNGVQNTSEASNDAEVMSVEFDAAAYLVSELDGTYAGTGGLNTGDIFIKRYNIVITVEDFDASLEMIDSLPGVNSGMNIDYGDYRQASITRSISQAEYQYGKEFLRGLGEINNESESESRISGEVLSLESRLKAKEEEIDRLLAILEKSVSLNYMTTVERRISEANRERDNLKTQINRYNSQASSCILNIVVKYAEPVEIQKPRDYFERLGEYFMKSMEFCMGAFEGIVVFISMALVPAIVLIIVIALLLFIIRGRGGKGEK